MDDDGAPDRLSFLDAALPPAFEVRLLVLLPGLDLAFLETEWRDALVVVERGELLLVRREGPVARFPRGDVLHLVGLGVLALRCGGRRPTVLTVVRRRWRPAHERRYRTTASGTNTSAIAAAHSNDRDT
jgi:hypothetical protein